VVDAAAVAAVARADVALFNATTYPSALLPACRLLFMPGTPPVLLWLVQPSHLPPYGHTNAQAATMPVCGPSSDHEGCLARRCFIEGGCDYTSTLSAVLCLVTAGLNLSGADVGSLRCLSWEFLPTVYRPERATVALLSRDAILAWRNGTP